MVRKLVNVTGFIAGIGFIVVVGILGITTSKYETKCYFFRFYLSIIWELIYLLG